LKLKERPILFSAPMVRALLDGRTHRQRLYAPRGSDPAAPEHLTRRLANGLDAAEDGRCWGWQRTRNDDGYGQLSVAGRMVYAHRLAFELSVGPVPKGLHILHSCDNPSCINPAHLSPGTRSQNMKECGERGRARIPQPIKLGEENGAAKLLEVDVLSIRRLLSKGDTQRSIAERFNVSQQTVAGIKSGKKWGNLK
jgi:hypothetical protein